MKICQQCKIDFQISKAEQSHCDQMNVPASDLCRECRIRNLMAARNEWKLYRRKCDFSGDEIISAYPSDSPFTIYKNEVWWGNDWDALKYGRDFDFNRQFFEQFAELQKEVPREGTTVFNSENCAYNSHIRESRNCYLCSLVYKCEDVYYSSWVVNDKNVYDSLYTNSSTLCYYCSDVNNSYECIALEESDNCNNCYFSYQLRGCDHCLYCSNLANKSYYLFNKPCSEEEFKQAKDKAINGSWTRWQEAYQHYLEMRKKAVRKYVNNLNCENVKGNHLHNSRNCDDCFEGFNSEHCVNSVSLGDATSAHSCYSAGWPDCQGPTYMSLVTRAGQDIAYCNYTWFSSGLRYCDSCNTCESCFGCIGLHHKKYCILNKQYSKEEYEELLPKIIEHMKSTNEWGQFFPKDLYTYAYNESAAMDFFPLSKDEAIAMGFKWRPKDEKEYQPATLSNITDNISDVDDSIMNEILACEKCSKNYKIIQQELKFYQENNLPIPRYCPTCRHGMRFQLRNPLKLFDRKCDKCQKEIKSSYSSDRDEKVLCGECYLKTVY